MTIAILDTDGLRTVVWGIGETEDAARVDAAQHEAYEQTQWERLAVLTDEQEERVEHGTVGAADLGINLAPQRFGGQVADAPISTCPVCHRPAHATETDDLDRHLECQGGGR